MHIELYNMLQKVNVFYNSKKMSTTLLHRFSVQISPPQLLLSKPKIFNHKKLNKHEYRALQYATMSKKFFITKNIVLLVACKRVEY